MRQLQDDSVMRSIATVKTTKTNEYQKLVSVGGTTVKRGTEGEARTETSTPKMERVDIKLNPIYAYPKTTQEILDFSEVDILGWLSSEITDTFTATEETDFVNGDGDKNPKGSCPIRVRPPAIKPVRSERWRKWKLLPFPLMA